MKFRHFLAGLVLCIAAVLIIGGQTAEAKVSKKIVLKPETTMEVHDSAVIILETSLKNVSKIEYKAGKITKTANKFWKNSNVSTWFDVDEETGKTTVSEWVKENGFYSFRVTLKNGKKYVNYIKLKNIAPNSEDCRLEATIAGVSAPDKDGNYTFTFDFYEQITTPESTFNGKKVGDTIKIGGREVTIIQIQKHDKEGNVVDQKAYDKNSGLIVVRPKEATQFFDPNNEYFFAEEDSADFGFIRTYEGDEFFAYEDYEYWDAEGYYCDVSDKVKAGVKYKVTKDTSVRLAYAGGADRFTDGITYVALRDGKKTIEGVYVYKEVGVYVFLKYNKKTKKFTNVVSEIEEIYMP